MIDNMFAKDDVKKSKSSDDIAYNHLDLVGDTARACLGMEQFNTYRKQYVIAEEKMVDAMLMCTTSYMSGSFGLNEYASKMLVYMTRLKDLRMLLDTVTINSKKGKK